MNPPLSKTCLLGAAALLLGACASGGGTTPIAAKGFAAPNDLVGLGRTFNISDISTYLTEDGTGGLTTQDVKLRIRKDGRPQITVGDKVYVLTSEGGGTFSTLQDDTDVLFLRIFVPDNNVVETVYLSFETEDSFSSTFFPVGYDTNPNTVAQQTGSATFTGEAIVGLRQDDGDAFRSGFSRGDARMVADFDADTISGTINFDRQENRSITLPDFVMTLGNARINGNGFAGNVSVNSGQLGDDLSLANGSYEGRFYGAGVDAAAGTITGAIDDAGSDAQILMQGSFLSQK